mmetsp:Transcript_3871/g.9223  ORF Transcript_3871/g.9223 Transcript_3871/m.9223 type:complete len:280 (-) Transcript_3871:645-1484(-)
MGRVPVSRFLDRVISVSDAAWPREDHWAGSVPVNALSAMRRSPSSQRSPSSGGRGPPTPRPLRFRRRKAWELRLQRSTPRSAAAPSPRRTRSCQSQMSVPCCHVRNTGPPEQPAQAPRGRRRFHSRSTALGLSAPWGSTSHLLGKRRGGRPRSRRLKRRSISAVSSPWRSAGATIPVRSLSCRSNSLMLDICDHSEGTLPFRKLPLRRRSSSAVRPAYVWGTVPVRWFMPRSSLLSVLESCGVVQEEGNVPLMRLPSSCSFISFREDQERGSWPVIELY